MTQRQPAAERPSGGATRSRVTAGGCGRGTGGAGPAAGLAARLGAAALTAGSVAASRVRARGDRGDVPGWVLVTLMTAGLVLVLWGVARERLTAVFSNAINSVVGGP